MTKTYEQRIDELHWGYSNSVSGVVVSESEAKGVASEADQEIANLKRLLQASVYFVRESGMFDSLATEIEEALKDE